MTKGYDVPLFPIIFMTQTVGILPSHTDPVFMNLLTDAGVRPADIFDGNVHLNAEQLRSIDRGIINLIFQYQLITHNLSGRVMEMPLQTGQRETFNMPPTEERSREDFVALRSGLRNILHEWGYVTNAGSGDEEILILIAKAVTPQGLRSNDVSFDEEYGQNWNTYWDEYVTALGQCVAYPFDISSRPEKILEIVSGLCTQMQRESIEDPE